MKSVRTYYYGVGFLGTYVFDKRDKFRNVGINNEDLKTVRASTIKEARQKAREARIEEFIKSIKILPEPKDARV